MSVWLREASVFPRLTQTVGHYDVVVVGGGIVGCTTAHMLKAKGKRVALLEAREVGLGTTGFSTAKLSAQQGLIYATMAASRGKAVAAQYYELNSRGIKTAEAIIKSLGIDCEFSPRSHFTWTSDEKKIAAVEEEFKVCTELGIPCTLWGAAEMAQELPVSVQAKRAISFEGQAQFNPYLFCKALAKDVNSGSCNVFEGTRVTDVAESINSRHEITVEGNIKLTSDQVVVATHLPILDRSMHFAFLSPSRSHCIAVKVVEGSSKIHNMFINTDKPMISIRTTENGRVVVVCGQPMKQGEDPETDKFYEHLEEWALAHLKVEKFLGRWSAMDYFTSEHVPYVGYLHRRTDSIYMACGFNKWGLAAGVTSAEIICDLIFKKENPLHPLVDSVRWDLRETKSALEENWHVTKHMIGDKVKHLLSTKSVDDLGREEGAVITHRGHKVGAYRDASGNLHLVKPICTHMLCDLVFNKGDKRWDCPCHGSRFDVDGKIISGPAVYPLEKLEKMDW